MSTQLVATVAGLPISVNEIDSAEARLRSGAHAAALPAGGTSEGRQLRRWLTQLIVTEVVVAAEAAARGLTGREAPTETELLPDLTARLEIGSVAAAALADPRARALFAAVTAGTTLLYPYTTGLSLVTVLMAVCWLATDVRPLASLVFAFTVSRVVYGFAYDRPSVMVGPTVITLGITASLVAACALAWLLRRRVHASPPMTG